jgi:group I intron endonuclease
MIVGIYKIESPSGKCYIGQSKDIQKRINAHKTMLRLGKHPNIRLSGAYKKYGIENLIFEILEICEIEDLTTTEQKYIDSCKSEYNMSRIAVNPMLDENIVSKVQKTRNKKGHNAKTSIRTKALFENEEYRSKVLKGLDQVRNCERRKANARAGCKSDSNRQRASEHSKKLWATGKLTYKPVSRETLDKRQKTLRDKNKNLRYQQAVKFGFNSKSKTELNRLRSLMRKENNIKCEEYRVLIKLINQLRRENSEYLEVPHLAKAGETPPYTPLTGELS